MRRIDRIRRLLPILHGRGQWGVLGGVLGGAVVTVFLVNHFLHR